MKTPESPAKQAPPPTGPRLCAQPGDLLACAVLIAAALIGFWQVLTWLAALP